MAKNSAIWTACVTCCPWDQQVANELKFVDSQGQTFECFQRVGDTMLVPRGYTGWGEDRTKTNDLGAINCTAKPRNEEQRQLIEQAVTLFKGQRRGFIINAPTGFGKTYLGVAIAGTLGQATLIVTHKSDLHKNWKEAATQLAGLPPTALGHVQQDVCDFKGRRFVLGSLQSLILPDRYPMEFYQHFGMVVFDEVHKLGSEEFSKVCTLFPARYRLGLSATTDRWDGRDEIFRLHIGPVLLQGHTVPMSPKIVVKKTRWTPPMAWQYNPATGGMEYMRLKMQPGRLIRAIKSMAEDPERNGHIVEFTLAAIRKGRKHVVIMSDLIDDHLKPLFHLLAKAGVPGEDMGFYIGGKNESQLTSAANKRVVLATYKMCDTGTDFPQWDTLVLATPRADVRQPVGRVLRSQEGKRTPVVLDLVDDNSLLWNFHLARSKQYHQLKAEIVRL